MGIVGVGGGEGVRSGRRLVGGVDMGNGIVGEFGELELKLVVVCKLRLRLRMGDEKKWSWKGIKRRRWARRCDDDDG